MADVLQMENGINGGSSSALGGGVTLNGNADRHKSKEHKSSHKHKHKDKDRDRKEHKSSHKDKHRDRDKDRHSSSKGHHSSSKDGSKVSSSSNNHSSSKDSSRSKDRHGGSKDGKSSSSDRHHSSKSSSSSHKKDHRDRDRHKDKHRSKERNGEERRDKSTGDGARQQQRKEEREKEEQREKEERRRDSDDFRVMSPKHEQSESEDVAAVVGAGGDNSVETGSDEESRLVIEDDAVTSPVKNEDELSEEDAPMSPRDRKSSFKEDSFSDERPSIKEELEDSYEKPSFQEELEDSDGRPSFKEELEESEEDIPLSARRKAHVKREIKHEDSEEDIPLSARKKSKPTKVKRAPDSEDEYQKPGPASKKKKLSQDSRKRSAPSTPASPTKKVKKEDEQEVWKWWEEEKSDPSVKWTTLEHKGPQLAPEYEPLPSSVKFFYDGKEMHLSETTEEVATFYAKMLEHDYTTKDVFNKNFMHDWRKSMTDKERETITSLKKCDFRRMAEYFKMKTEERKAMSKEDKKKLKEKNEALVKEYGFCMLDGHKEKIGNFRVEPPGLFRGRGEHPKQGMVKRRLLAKDIIINCGKDSKWPKPPEGQRWKSVQHDNTVTWLACWKENIQGQIKYVMLNAASRLKGEKDWNKYEVARRLHKCVDRIRSVYREDFKSKEMRVRQRSVAMYFIDKLALRAGNEKDEDQADTVGCCSLRVEHITLKEQLNGKEYVVVFDFLGKDSIRYYNEVAVEKRVFKNLALFMDNKEPGDDLFDRLNTTILNKHLTELMDGLSAKVFRTYNASHTLQQQLNELTEEDMTVNEKILAYNRANRAVAILCNHQRAVPKTFEKSMENLMNKIADKKEQLADAEKQLKSAKKAAKNSMKERGEADKKRKAVERISDQLKKLELQATDKEENKEIALGTSKLNYLDPRISVAWCKKWDVPIEKVYNKTQRDKFRWAIDMAGPDFEF